MKRSLTRRGFIQGVGAASAILPSLRRAPAGFAANSAKPALLGGTPAHSGAWLKWPQWRESWEPEILKVYRSGKWYRDSGENVSQFESFQELKGNKQVCDTTVGISQNLLLANRSDLGHVIEAIGKIQTHSAALARA